MAHASVASLMRTIKSLLIPNSPMQSLTYFEKNNISGEMRDLKVEVATVVEHTIQLRVTEVVLANDENLRKKAHERLSDSLQQVAEDIDCICKESTKIQDKGKRVSEESLVQDFSSSTNDILNVKINMVGRDDQRKWLLEHLTRSYSGEPKVILIVGMGGIGKTTLAKEIYNDVSILHHFDVRAWTTVSQQHNVKEILLSLLRSTKRDKFCMGSEAELADMLQKSLKGKRYLIVLDDMWKSESWDDMDFMDQDESWNLFKSAFANKALPSEFETRRKRIAEKCHGLPLTILVVAALLKSKMTIEDWESVAKHVKSFVTNDPDEQCAHVLGLSFGHLTSDLKACLLYFGIFPEDTEIPVMNLMRSWMAEGFLNLEKDLEGEAEKCLQYLINRCLVLVTKKIQRGNVFIMNDIVLEKSDASHVPSECQSLSSHSMKPSKRWTDDEISDFHYGLYRALLTPGHRQFRDDDNNNLLKRTRSIFFSGRRSSTFILKSEILKILDLSHIRIGIFPLQILSLIWLRYLSLLCREKFDVPQEICRLWNLQTIIVNGYARSDITFPKKIWELMQLRHLKLNKFYLPNRPNGSVDKARLLGFSNIQTISNLSPCCCTKEVISGIQNVKKLGIKGDEDDYESFQNSGLLNNLVHLQQLETLSLTLFSTGVSPAIVPSAKAFPATLKRLKLERTYLSWPYLDIIAELPNLEVLKLINQFKYLNATSDNFLVLERLILSNCHYLKEIPIEFADIHTLQLIDLRWSNPELDASATQIQQEQENIGNQPVDVRILKPLRKS
ncbi:hypothetical protein P3S68_030263 [Capsicum galapagoense]